MKKIISQALPFICIFIITTIFFIDLFSPKLQIYATPDFGHSDLWMGSIPARYLVANALQNNELLLWTKNLGGGFPLFAAQTGVLNPMNLLLFKFLPFDFAFSLSYPLVFLISALGTYLFCQAIKLSKKSSIFAAVAFSFSGYFFAQISHVEIIQTALILPWMFLISLNFFNKPSLKNFLFFSLGTAISIFSSFAQVTFVTFIGIAFFVLFLSIDKKYFSKNKVPFTFPRIFLIFTLFALATIWGCLLSGIQLIPALEFIKESPRSGGLSLNTATYFSFPPIHLLGFVDPFIFGNPANGTYPDFNSFDGSIFWENTGYVGILPLIFVVLSFFNLKKNKYYIFFWILLIISFILMIGKYSPVKEIYSLPVFSLFRVPSRFILLFVWALSILSGLFFNQLESKFNKTKYQNYFRVIAVLMLVFLFFDLYRVWHDYNPKIQSSKFFETPKAAKEIINHGKGTIITIDNGTFWNKIFLSSGWRDPESYLFFKNLLRQNINSMYDIPQIGVFAGNSLSAIEELNGLILSGISIKNDNQTLIGKGSEKLLKTQGVKYIITPFQIDNLFYKKIAFVDNKRDNSMRINIYALDSVNKAYLVYKKTVVKKSEVVKYITKSSFDPEKEVILEKDDKKIIKSAEEKNAEVEIIKDVNSFTQLRVKNNPTDGYLILANTYYPGWKAFLDKKEVDILAANLKNQAIFIPKGNHEAIFKYQPFSFLIGKYTTILFILISMAMIIYKWKWKKKKLFF